MSTSTTLVPVAKEPSWLAKLLPANRVFLILHAIITATGLGITVVAGIQGSLPTTWQASTAYIVGLLGTVGGATAALLKFLDGSQKSEALAHQTYQAELTARNPVVVNQNNWGSGSTAGWVNTPDDVDDPGVGTVSTHDEYSDQPPLDLVPPVEVPPETETEANKVLGVTNITNQLTSVGTGNSASDYPVPVPTWTPSEGEPAMSDKDALDYLAGTVLGDQDSNNAYVVEAAMRVVLRSGRQITVYHGD